MFDRMVIRFICLFLVLLISFNTKASEKFDVDYHDAFFGVKSPIHIGKHNQLESKGLVKDWVEIDISISKENKYIGLKFTRSSPNQAFNDAVIKMLSMQEMFLRPKVVDGEPVASILKYRYDICFDTQDDYGDGGCIRGQLKLLNSSIKIEDIESQKKALIYFQYEVPINSFTAFQVDQQDDFEVIKVKKNLSLPSFFQNKYAEDFGFNSLNNKELLSFFEFREALRAYTDTDSEMIHDKDRNVIKRETFNEYKPIAEKTEYWFTRPKSAKPKFTKSEHLFGSYYAELDHINYAGKIRLKSRVEPTGLLTHIEIIRGSGIDRIDEITLKVLDRMYITPAYQDYQNVSDEIEFEVNFFR